MAGLKKKNSYCAAIGSLYDSTPKAVFAAIALSALTCGGDWLDEGTEANQKRLILEWQALYGSGIVPQKPPQIPDVELSNE